MLEERTVGREDALVWLEGACRDFLSGSPPTWRLLVGARGHGKSHLLQVVRCRIGPEHVRWVGEDQPLPSDADRFWESLWRTPDPWAWTASHHGAERVLFLEGLDRILVTLGEKGAWSLRHRLRESGVMLVATSLSPAIAAGEREAFFGQLDTWVLQPLDLDASRSLFDHVAGGAPSDSQAQSRREALVRLAGGSPRAIVTLADAVAGTDVGHVGTAEGLLRGVQRLVIHYQQRFRDLPPLGQQMVHALAAAPRALTAGEVAATVHATSAAVSGAARTLESAGTLDRSPDPADGRVSRYSLGEPLFRYWLEYRTTPSWEETRISWFSRLLGEVLTRRQLTDVWWSSDSEEVRRAVARHGRWPLQDDAMDRLRSAAEGDLPRILARVRELPMDDTVAVLVLLALLGRDRLDLFDLQCGPLVRATSQLANELRTGPPKRALTRFVRALSDVARTGPWPLVALTVQAMLHRADRRGRPWAPLQGADARALAGLPNLRVMFATQGKHPGHPPLLEWGSLWEHLEDDPPDAPELLSAAHTRGDAMAFRRAGMFTTSELPLCPRPDLVAPVPEVVAHLAHQGLGAAYLLSWSASLAALDQDVFEQLVVRRLRKEHLWDRPRSLMLSALLALGARNRARFDALAAALPEHGTLFHEARRGLAQLAERRVAPLQPELELVWQAIAPPDGTSSA